MLPRVDTRPRRQNSKKADYARRSPEHLQWLGGRPCCVGRREGCGGKIEAAHVDHAGGKGIGIKVHDWKAVPLCADHHAELHRGAKTFEAKYAVDLVTTAEAYARRSPHKAGWAHLEEAPR